jgi:hypothetical protein
MEHLTIIALDKRHPNATLRAFAMLHHRDPILLRRIAAIDHHELRFAAVLLMRGMLRVPIEARNHGAIRMARRMRRRLAEQRLRELVRAERAATARADYANGGRDYRIRDGLGRHPEQRGGRHWATRD